MTLEHPLLNKIINLNPVQNKIFLKHDGNVVVYFYYRNKIDYIIVFETQVQLMYLPSKNIYKRLDGIMKFCIRLQLAKKDCLICHGAVLTKQERCIAVMGSPMIGKTMTTLLLLSNGWNYIADDKFILANNHAYQWEDTIAIRPQYHFKCFPHIKKTSLHV